MGTPMNAASLTLAFALFAGVLMAVQAPTNALLGKASGSPVVAAFISFIVGTVALGALVAAGSGRLFAPELKSLPWYAWLGGLYGAFFVAIAAFGAPKVGVGPLLTAAIGGQLIGAIILDHYGLLGLARQPVSIEKVGGVLLVLLGAWLVRRG
jgi:transporter family-2 protein